MSLGNIASCLHVSTLRTEEFVSSLHYVRKPEFANALPEYNPNHVVERKL